MDVLDLKGIPSDMKCDLWYILRTTGDLPPAQVGHTAVFCQEEKGDKIVIIGGATPEQVFNDIWVVDITTLQCSLKQASGDYIGRYEHCSFTPSLHKLYKCLWVYSGATMDENRNDLWELNLDSMMWTLLEQKGSLPSPRTFHSSESGEILTVFGGGHKGSDPVADTSMYQLDPESKVWSMLSTTGEAPSPRHGHIIVTVGEKIFCHGGMAGPEIFDDLYILEKTKEWKRVSASQPSPSARAGHGAVHYNKMVYIFGGLGESDVLNDLWKFSIETMTWEEIVINGPMPSARLDFAITVILLPKVFPNDEIFELVQNRDHESASSKVPCILIHGGMDCSGQIYDDFCVLRIQA